MKVETQGLANIISKAAYAAEEAEAPIRLWEPP
jgi:hypothetical protein